MAWIVDTQGSYTHSEEIGHVNNNNGNNQRIIGYVFF